MPAGATFKYYRFDALLQQQGFIRPAYVGVDEAGDVRYLADAAPRDGIAVEYVAGAILPGFPNAHSHAFQFAMAGTAEKHSPGTHDDFWTWRQAMYECALSMNPDQMQAVAAMLYAEMLRRGYTHVVEFHYLHHDEKGRPYANLAEMGERLVAAAGEAGIRITLVPVYYERGGFGRAPEQRQRRFISNSLDDYLRLLEATRKIGPAAQIGFGVHSLRAVEAGRIFQTLERGPRDLPFHMHVAEQVREVADCVEYLGKRPVEWLLDNLPVQERFNLVHCTHLNETEIKGLAQSGANVILCPGTEGNLGDGVFPLVRYSSFYGNWCIGTDSHISINPFENLRWLDYAQRLATHKRNTFDDPATVFVNKAVPCGRRAAGVQMSNFFEIGKPLDGVVFDSEAPLLFQSDGEHLLPAIVYTADPSAVLGTMVGAKWVVYGGHHVRETAIARAFKSTVTELRRK